MCIFQENDRRKHRNKYINMAYNIINDYILFSSDDEDNGNIAINRRQRQFKQRRNYLEELDAIDFKIRFRLNKETVLIILNHINDEIQSRTDRYV